MMPVTKPNTSVVPRAVDGAFVESDRSPEARLLIRCARTTPSEPTRRLIRQGAQEPIDWALLLDLAHQHGVGPLLYRNLSNLCADLVPADVLSSLHRIVQARAAVNQAVGHELVRLCREFHGQGLPILPFSGVALAAMAYRDLSLRDGDDVSAVVFEDRLVEAQQLLRSHEYKEAQSEAGPNDTSSAFVHPNGLLRVRLQYEMPHDAFSFRLDQPDVWGHIAKVQINGRPMRMVSPEDLLIILCLHGTHDVWDRLTWVADVAELVRAQPVHWKRLLAQADRWKCRRVLLLGLTLANRLLNAPVPPPILHLASVDHYVSAFPELMLKNLLARPQHAIEDRHKPAFYFMLKDLWWERWLYGLQLIRRDHPVLRNLPSWLRWRWQLGILTRLLRLFRASAIWAFVKKRFGQSSWYKKLFGA